MKAWTGLVGMLGGLAVWLPVIGPSAMAQPPQAQHVVAQEELTQDLARASETRQANEAAVRHLFSTGLARQTLKSAKIDYGKVDRAVSQLSDDELDKLASRARQTEHDFAAGFISAKTVAYIVLALVVIITLVVLIT